MATSIPRLSKRAFEELYRRLGRLAREPGAADRDELLTNGLASLDPHLVTRAARVITSEHIAGFEVSLLRAYEHFFTAATKRDPGCLAKLALAEALDFLDHDSTAPFLRGVAFVQKEGPAPQVDAAAGLRARCGLALVRLRVPDALTHLADLLADPEPGVRAAAADALAYHGDERGAALLRLKLNLGEPDGDVATALLRAYLVLDEPRGLTLAQERLLAGDSALRESAALALGDLRRESALPLLQEYVARSLEERDLRAGLVALLSLRSSSALQALHDFAAESEGPRACIARELLETLAGDAASAP